jgi:hypothetical protein
MNLFAELISLRMKRFPIGLGIPEARAVPTYDEISKMQLDGSSSDLRLGVEMLCKIDIVLNHQIERTRTNLLCDNGQDFLVLIDQIAGAVEDVQNSWRFRACKPILSSAGHRYGINDLFHDR